MKPVSRTWRVLLDLGGGRGQSGNFRSLLPLHLSPGPLRDGGEGRICTLGAVTVSEGRPRAFPAALGVGGGGGGHLV